jgi:lipid A 3-O-deacylase
VLGGFLLLAASDRKSYPSHTIASELFVTQRSLQMLHLCFTALLLVLSTSAFAQTDQLAMNPLYTDAGAARRPLEFGAIVQGGNGLTEDRDGLHFLMAGVHAGKVLTGNFGPGVLRGNLEYAVEAFPFWQSYTPKFQRANCIAGTTTSLIACSPLYTVGGTYTGASVTPIILRWNLAGTRRMAFWGQAAGGVLWTNHKYPAFGSPVLSLTNDGPNTEASVWNFTPQGGVGLHYFIKPRRSIDFGANAIHISSASLGDKNPGVNASVQFSLGYSWWK